MSTQSMADSGAKPVVDLISGNRISLPITLQLSVISSQSIPLWVCQPASIFPMSFSIQLPPTSPLPPPTHHFTPAGWLRFDPTAVLTPPHHRSEIQILAPLFFTYFLIRQRHIFCVSGGLLLPLTTPLASQTEQVRVCTQQSQRKDRTSEHIASFWASPAPYRVDRWSSCMRLAARVLLDLSW